MHWTVHVKKSGSPRVNHAVVSVGQGVYSFGGYTGENFTVIRNIDSFVLDQETYRWKRFETEGDIPCHRYGHTTVAHGQHVYLWGGRVDSNALSNLYRLDTGILTWERLTAHGTVPEARDGHSAVIIGNKMLIFGGFGEETRKLSQDVHSLDLETLEWSLLSTKGAPPCHRDFHTAAAYQDRYMLIFGGRGDKHGPVYTRNAIYDNSLFCFDVEKLEWSRPTTTGRGPVGRRSHSAFMHNGFMYIFGGYNGVLDEHFNDLFRYDPENFHWQQIAPSGEGPGPRRRQGCVVVDNRALFFGGTCPDLNNPKEHNDSNQQEEHKDSKLTDLDDTFVLDMTEDSCFDH